MKTKHIYLAVALAVGASTFSSCSDYLDVDRYFNDRMTEEKLFEDKTYAEEWLAGVYSHLKKWNEDVCKIAILLSVMLPPLFGIFIVIRI